MLQMYEFFPVVVFMLYMHAYLHWPGSGDVAQ